MTEVEKILLTSSLTILGGVFVFVVGQVIMKFFIEPTQNLRKLIGEIAFALDFYANQIYAEQPKSDEARQVYRKHGCQLRELSHMIFCYWLASFICCALPPKKDLARASSLLIGLSNQCGGEPAGVDRSSDIKKHLRIR